MAKLQVKNHPSEESNEDPVKDKEKKSKDGKALVGQVKKVIKKSRRKLSEEKFEKQLQRTITFLEELQAKLAEANQSTNAVNQQKSAKSGKRTRSANSGKKNKESTAAAKSGAATTVKAGVHAKK